MTTSKLLERVQRLAPAAFQDSRPRLGTVGGEMRPNKSDGHGEGHLLAAFVVWGRIELDPLAWLRLLLIL